jgi:CheY-like chemotaxis protein
MNDRETKTVLIVDGSATMLYYLGILLKRLEYSVLATDTPEHALTIMDRTLPSVIVTAIAFPAMNVFDFIKTVKSRERNRTIPVIVLTAEEHESTRSACLDAGCVAYLLKPVDPSALHRAIQAAVETIPRENIRINTSLKTVIGEKQEREAAERIEYATTISEKGMYVRMLSPLAKNELLPVRVYVEDREIKAKAMVLYTNAFERGTFTEPGMGLKFIEISEDDQRFLRDFINAQLVSDIVVDPPEESAGFDLDLAK